MSFNYNNNNQQQSFPPQTIQHHQHRKQDNINDYENHDSPYNQSSPSPPSSSVLNYNNLALLLLQQLVNNNAATSFQQSNYNNNNDNTTINTPQPKIVNNNSKTAENQPPPCSDGGAMMTMMNLNNSEETTTPVKSRPQKKTACVFCNKLHKKCDGESPNSCSRCKSKGIACVYLQPQKRGPKKRKADGEQVDYCEQVTNHFTQNHEIQQSSLDTPFYHTLVDNSQTTVSGKVSIASIYSSPLSGLQFNVSVQTRTLVDQFLDSVTCHSLVDKNMLDHSLNKSSPKSSQSEPTGFQLLTNIVCAMGAQRLEDRKNCVEFFNRARTQASYLFDTPSRETSCALSLMGVYACSEGETVKSHMYNRIALEMSTNICSFKVENDRYYQAFSALSFANSLTKWLMELNASKIEENTIDNSQTIQDIVNNAKSHIESPKCRRKIEELENKIQKMTLIKGSEEISLTATLIYYLLSSKIASLLNNQTELVNLLRKLEILEKYIECDKFEKDDVQKNVHRFCLYSLRSDILVRCGLEKMGLHSATMATGLAAKPSFWKSAPVIIMFFPVLIKINLKVNDTSMIVENYRSLKIISSKFVVLQNTLSEMINVMRRRSEFNDIMSNERNGRVQAVSHREVAPPTDCQKSAPQQCDPIQSFSTVQLLSKNSVENNNSNESFLNSDINELLQQLESANGYEDYQHKSVWQPIN